MAAREYEPVVDLIRDHGQVMFFCNTSDFRECFEAGNCTSGIIWVTNKYNLSAGGYGILYFLRYQGEVVFHAAWNFYRHSSCNVHICLV